ncbi:hypothetical protein GCM10008024_20830 [Allgaiera indica]|uniref:Uncharacterized protein n=2 Tax=Allgaiera indica TaxID=765699 RepID=A0AAN4ZZL7_9RHOB|nr:hypothetical protein GCM10008024_20830 [Allgaiera indica]
MEKYVRHSSPTLWEWAMEDDRKRIKFKELAEKRTNKALEAIRLIGNLSNRQNYRYEDQEARKIVKALREAVSEIEGKFNQSSSRNGGEFKL